MAHQRVHRFPCHRRLRTVHLDHIRARPEGVSCSAAALDTWGAAALGAYVHRPLHMGLHGCVP